MMNRSKPSRERRRLAALMFTDVVGFSRHAHREEENTVRLLEEQARTIRSMLPEYGGQVLKTTGDGFFIEFQSVVEAVRCACEIQARLYEWNLSLPFENRLWIRIGIHLGDVIDTGDDTYGNDVNISARLEKFAHAGGVCVTQPVMEQIEGKLEIKFRYESRSKMRNIQRPVRIYSLELPWTPRSGLNLASIFSPTKIRSSIHRHFARFIRANNKLDSLIIGVLGTTVIGSFLVAGIPSAHLSHHENRGKKGNENKISSQLQTGWTVSSEPEKWQEFDISSPWSKAEHFQSTTYRLKLHFRLDQAIDSPAITLGEIPERHRVLLNGKVIGGAGRQNPTNYFAFDSSILKLGGMNELLIEAFSDDALYPALSAIPRVRPFLGEISEVQENVGINRIFMDSSRLSTVAVSLILVIAAGLFYILNPRKRKYVYFALFLVLGCMVMAFYNPMLTAGMGFRRFTVLKALPLALAGPILVSLYLSVEARLLSERVNNLLATIFALTIGVILSPNTTSPSVFVDRTNWVFGMTFFYGMGSAFIVLTHIIQRARNRPPGEPLFDGPAPYGFVVVAFCTFTSIFALTSVRGQFVQFVPIWSRQMYDHVAVMYPAVIASITVLLSMGEYRRKSLMSAIKREQDNLMLWISRLISSDQPFEKKFELLQKQLCDYLEVERSTFYIVDQENPTLMLHATATLRPPEEGRSLIQTVALDSGLLGYVSRNRSAILLRDMAGDPRFSDLLSTRKYVSRYKTSSCMLLPLIVGNELLGILTFADKKNGGPLTAEDFQLLHMVGKDLALMVSTYRFQKLVDGYNKKDRVENAA